ncbi:MAG: IS66 family transposase [Oscillospiraceae bacterium]|nr:IS66 family transposase [Oscillospiraceae bacterium]
MPEQLGLFNEPEVSSQSNAPEPKLEQVIAHTRKKRNGRRDEFYEGIPTERIVHELPESGRICPECGGALHACGHEVLRRELEIIPAQVRTVEHVQTVYSCRNCETTADDKAVPMVKSAVPAPVIPGSGVASPSLLSFLLCNKYVLALPLYRQEQELRRLGINISRQTMANWVIYSSEHWLTLIYELLHAELLKNDILHADETTVQVINEKNRKPSQKSYMWLYQTGKYAERQVALFEYRQTRESEHPLTFLSDFSGFLHVDAYSGYKKLEERGVTIVECWAHARRKFDETLKALKKEDKPNSEANTGLEYCNKLFALERKYDEAKLTPDERRERRGIEAAPVAADFFAWAESVTARCLPKSKLAVAVNYALNQRQWLMNFMLDGRLEISNNRAETSIRPFTVGRKNWLFSVSPKGASASSVVYSIVETALANGLVPFMYLNHLFQTLPNISTSQLGDCLPWNPLVQQICKIPAPDSTSASAQV